MFFKRNQLQKAPCLNKMINKYQHIKMITAKSKWELKISNSFLKISIFKMAIVTSKIHFTPNNNLSSLIEYQHKHLLLIPTLLELMFQIYKKKKIIIFKVTNLNSWALATLKIWFNQLAKLPALRLIWGLKEFRKLIKKIQIIFLMAAQYKLTSINKTPRLNFKWVIKDR